MLYDLTYGRDHQANWRRGNAGYRDCKLHTDTQAAAAWHRASRTHAQLQAYSRSIEGLLTALQSQSEACAARDRDHCVHEQNVPITLTLSGGQVEATRGQALPTLSDAALLSRDIVAHRNAQVALHGSDVLGATRDCAAERQARHLVTWSLEMDDLAARHKREHVRELQLVHVTRDVAQVLEGGADGPAPRSPAKQAELMLEHGSLTHVRDACALFQAPLPYFVQVSLVMNLSMCACSPPGRHICDRQAGCCHLAMRVTQGVQRRLAPLQAAQVERQRRAFIAATDKVARGIEANEALSCATEEARNLMRGRKHLEEVAVERAVAQARANRLKFREIVTTQQLATLVRQQTQAILALRREKARWVRRSFPAFEAAPQPLQMPGGG